MKRIITNALSILLLILAVIIFVATNYIQINFGEYIKELIFYITTGIMDAGGNALTLGIKECIIPILIVLAYLSIPIIGFIKYKPTFTIRILKKEFKISFPIKHKILYSLILLILSVAYFFVTFDIKSILTPRETSQLYEQYYVDGHNVEVTFPNEKRNLIIIFAESMESTLVSKDKGGKWEYTLIPELENIASDNINFSENEKIGGGYEAYGTSWTVAGMVGQTSGISMSNFPGKKNNYAYPTNFMNGAYTLGDVLKDNGYNLELLIGSDANFGGRKQYFEKHGNYKIFDYMYAAKNNLVGEYIWWGFEDYEMFDFAKKELNELSKKEEPFNLVLLTADTHFTDGCMQCVREENKITKYGSTYENVLASSSKEIGSFVSWVQEQEFYDDTTIVIIGDHLSMQPNFFGPRNIEKETRTVYNAFINSAIETEYSKNRTFSTLDIYPTILASIGAEIPGEKLGLGTNLFSGEKTLFEELGRDKVNEELTKSSDYYKNEILKDYYTEILTTTK